MEEIRTITQAEETARQAKTEALAAARRAGAEALAEGKALLAGAGGRAARELAVLEQDNDARIRAEQAHIFENSENRKAGLRARAEARLDRAAALITERILNR